MSLRRAGPADSAAIRAHLLAHLAGSMFPLSNLDRFGIDGTDRRSLRLWQAPGGVVAVTRDGMVLPQWTEGADWPAFAALCPGPLIGAAGPADQVRPCLAALGLAGAPAIVDRDEPHFDLPLSEMRLPDCTGFTLVPARDADPAVAQAWQAAFRVEALGCRPDENPRFAREEVAAAMAEDSLRILTQGGTPVAMTGFNARAAHAVQIGSVYTPPALRGRGLARRAVALHLAEARDRAGVTFATLFAASPAAARAYRAIGFRPCGLFSVTGFAGQQRPHNG